MTRTIDQNCLQHAHTHTHTHTHTHSLSPIHTDSRISQLVMASSSSPSSSSSSQLHALHWLRSKAASVQRAAVVGVMNDALNVDTMNDGSSRGKGRRDNDEEEKRKSVAALEATEKAVMASGGSPCVVSAILAALEKRFSDEMYVQLLVLLLRKYSQHEKEQEDETQGSGAYLESAVAAELARLACEADTEEACSAALDALVGAADSKRDAAIDVLLGNGLAAAIARESRAPESARIAFVNAAARIVRVTACAPDARLRIALRGAAEGDTLGRRVIDAACAGVASADVYDARARSRACAALSDIADALETRYETFIVHRETAAAGVSVKDDEGNGDGDDGNGGNGLEAFVATIVSMCVRYQAARVPFTPLLEVALRAVRNLHQPSADALHCRSELYRSPFETHCVDLCSLVPFAGGTESVLLLRLIDRLLVLAHVGRGAARFLLQSACAFAASPPRRVAMKDCDGARLSTRVLETVLHRSALDGTDADCTNTIRGRAWLDALDAPRGAGASTWWPGPWSTAYSIVETVGIAPCVEAVDRAITEGGDTHPASGVFVPLLGFALISSFCDTSCGDDTCVDSFGEVNVDVLARVLRAYGAYGGDVLPLMLALIQRVRDPHSLHRLLGLLPSAAVHYTTSAAVENVLATFDKVDSQRPLRVMLLARMWMNTCRDFRKLCSTITDSDSTRSKCAKGNSSLAPPALRVARSVCVRDICSAEAESGVELVHSIDAALHDSLSAVRIPAFDAIYSLCTEDVLDWKSTYAYVHAICPSMPMTNAEEMRAWAQLRIARSDLEEGEDLEVASAMIRELYDLATAAHSGVSARLAVSARYAAISALCRSDTRLLTSTPVCALSPKQWSALCDEIQRVHESYADGLVRLLSSGLVHDEMVRRRSSAKASDSRSSEDVRFGRQQKAFMKVQIRLCESALRTEMDDAHASRAGSDAECASTQTLLAGLSPQSARVLVARHSSKFRSRKTLFADSLSSICSGADANGDRCCLMQNMSEKESWDAFMAAYLHVLSSECHGEEDYVTNVAGVQTKLEKLVHVASPAAAAAAIVGLASLARTASPRCRLQMSRMASFIHEICSNDTRACVRTACVAAVPSLISSRAAVQGIAATSRRAFVTLLLPWDSGMETWRACIGSWSLLCGGLFASDARDACEREDTDLLQWIAAVTVQVLRRICDDTPLAKLFCGALDSVLHLKNPCGAESSVRTSHEQNSAGPIVVVPDAIYAHGTLIAAVLECASCAVTAMARSGSYNALLVDVMDSYVNESRGVIERASEADTPDTFDPVTRALLTSLPSVIFGALDSGVLPVSIVEELVYTTSEAAVRTHSAEIALLASALIDGALVCGVALPLTVPQSIFNLCVRAAEGGNGESVDTRINALAGMGNMIGAGISVTPFSCRRESRAVDAGASNALDSRRDASDEASTTTTPTLAGALVTQAAALDLVTSIVQTLSSLAMSDRDSRVRDFAGSISSRALASGLADMRARDATTGDGGINDDVATVSSSAALEGGSMLSSLLGKLMPQTKMARSSGRKHIIGLNGSDGNMGEEDEYVAPSGLVLTTSFRCLYACKSVPLVGWDGIVSSALDDRKGDASAMRALVAFLVKQSAMGKPAFTSILSSVAARCWQQDACGLRLAVAEEMPAIAGILPVRQTIACIEVLVPLAASDAFLASSLWLSCSSLLGLSVTTLSSVVAAGDREVFLHALRSLSPLLPAFPHPSRGALSVATRATSFWSSAISQLVSIDDAVLTQILDAMDELSSVYVRCRLAVHGRLPWTRVAEMRACCFDRPDDSYLGILECARALMSAPSATTRRNFVLDGLDAVVISSHAAHALRCMYCVIVFFSAADLRGLVEAEPSAALHLLPCAVPLLVSQEEWMTSGQAVVSRLLRAMQIPTTSTPTGAIVAITASVHGHRAVRSGVDR